VINFIYLAVNSINILEETYFSILTLLYFKDNTQKDFRIIIYTDRPDFFKDLGELVSIEYLSKVNIRESAGKYNFFFRNKLTTLISYSS